MGSNFTSLRWWCWFCLSLQCVGIFIQRVWFPEFTRAHTSRNTFQWLLPNIAFAIWKTILRNLHYVQCLNIAPMQKAWLMAPNGKRIMASMEYSLITYSPNGRGMVLWNIVFQVVTIMAKEKKMHYKRYSVNENYFYALQELYYKNKRKFTSSFWGVLYGLYFSVPFLFSLLLSIG